MLAGPKGTRNTNRKITMIKKCIEVSHKQFGGNGVGLHVKRRLDFLYVQHLVDQTIKLALTFPQNFAKVVNLLSVVGMPCFKVFQCDTY